MQKTAPEALGVVYRMPISDLHPHPLNPYGIRNDPPISLLLCDIIFEWYAVNYPEEYKQLDIWAE